jgi:hypothetical protein
LGNELVWWRSIVRIRPRPRQLARDILQKMVRFRESESPFYLRWMENLINPADAVTVNNQFLQKRYGGIYLPNGKDTQLFRSQSLRSRRLSSKVRFIWV